MLSKSKKIIVLTGPTAVGKTAASINLAKQLDCDIINADSRQIFKEMSIGTAKPDKQILSIVPHHLIDFTSIHTPFSTGDYMRQGRKILQDLFKKDNFVIVSGGTGLYIKALLFGINEFPAVSSSTLSQLEQEFNSKGLEPLQNELKTKDLKYFENSDIQNSRRVLRALSIIRETGKTYSSFTDQKPKGCGYDFLYFVLERPREELYKRINKRVDLMMNDGLLAEAKSLYPYKNLRALQTVGYQELFDYFDNKISEEDAINKIKQHTRNYAKRQLTWFRSVEEAIYIKAQDHVVQNILNHIK